MIGTIFAYTIVCLTKKNIDMKKIYLVSKASRHSEFFPMEVTEVGQFDSKKEALDACMKDKDWVNMEEVSGSHGSQFRNFNAINGKEVIFTISEVTCPSIDPLLAETLISFGAQFVPKLCRLSVKNDESYDANEACVRIAELARQFENSLNWEENQYYLDYADELEKFVNSHIEELYEQVRV